MFNIPLKFIGGGALWIWMAIYKLYLPFKPWFKGFFYWQKQRLVGLMTNKYVIHFVILLVAIFVTVQNISAFDDVLLENAGKNSILYVLIGPDEIEQIVEQVGPQDKREQQQTSPTTYIPFNAVSSFPLVNSDNPETDLAFVPSTLLSGSTVMKPNIINTESIKKRDTVVAYVIQDGDTLSTIADKFGVSVNTILWENNLSVYTILKPKTSLRILPTTGIKHVVKKGDTLEQLATQYGTNADEIVSFNKLANASDISIGQELIVPNAKKQLAITSTPRPNTATSNPTKTTTAKALITNFNQTNWTWPTDTYRITQYYSWKHQALDIGGAGVTHPIYAAADGVIIIAGWQTGYGNTYKIDHENGYTTRYGHLSQRFFEKGQRVKKGELIGMMGTTGWSTGIHLHFEIMKGSTKLNPLNMYK